ncbi:Olfactory receptor 1F12, partial [Balearica regulorum gibbericeps]
SNSSSITEFLLLALADTRELQLLHFWLFLGIYLAALLGNGLIITASACHHHLHTPMYFMSYDRYVAICQPLPYGTLLGSRACVHMAAAAWGTGFLNAVLHTASTFSIQPCKGNAL